MGAGWDESRTAAAIGTLGISEIGIDQKSFGQAYQEGKNTVLGNLGATSPRQLSDKLKNGQEAIRTPRLPSAAPDLGDAAMSAQQRADVIRQRMTQGRRSSFLVGPDQEMSMLPKKKSALGGE